MAAVSRLLFPPQTAFDAYTRHVNPSLGRFLELSGRATRFVRAKGILLEDEDGKVFHDWVCGFGTFSLGHNPDVLTATIQEHLESDPPNLFVESLNPFSGDLADALVKLLPGFETCFFTNSGSEAVEAAIKTAVLVTGRSQIVYADRAYHGTTIGALGCMGESVYREGLAGVLPAFREVPFGDLAALEAALSDREVAGFLLEPVQMEAGVRIADPSYLRDARSLCGRFGTLFILDEVQTGMGRTGSLFAFERAGARPDILVSAKALGGGIVPIGAAIFAEGIWRRAYDGPLRAEVLHSTFGGNALACRVARKTVGLISEPSFLASVKSRGEALFGALEKAVGSSPAVERVSGVGLLGGVAFREISHPALGWEEMGLPEFSGKPVAGPLVVERLARSGILAQVCGHDWSVVRVQPPLNVDSDSCRAFVHAMSTAVSWLEKYV
jgi:acetylornithine/succinyldiaminopimelate/putrescine aminotransferase